MPAGYLLWSASLQLRQTLCTSSSATPEILMQQDNFPGQAPLSLDSEDGGGVGHYPERGH